MDNCVQIKINRLARTISEFEGSREITDESIWKAVALRRITPKNKKGGEMVIRI